jgi:hypothetical protein
MIIPSLHRQPVALDRVAHAGLLVLQRPPDWRFAATQNAVFVAGAEIADLCREYPILFVHAAPDEAGRPLVAPIAALGLVAGENLFVQGGQWRASSLPATLRAYPFCLGRAAGEPARGVVCFDEAWDGWSRSEGAPLFDAAGAPLEHLRTLTQQLEQFEVEVQRTRELGRYLLERELLRDMRFDAELTGGGKLQVDGFMAIDDKRLAALPDADLLQMQRSGILGLVHAHFISLANMRKLVQWRVERGAPAAQSPA